MNVLLVVDGGQEAGALPGLASLQTGCLRLVRSCDAQQVEEAMAQGDYDLVLLDLRETESEPPWLEPLLRRWALRMPLAVLLGSHDEALHGRLLKLGAQTCLQRSELQGMILERRLCEAVKRFSFVAELRQSSEQAEYAEAQLAALVGATQEGIVVTDYEGITLFATPATEQILQQPASELLGWPLPWQLPIGDKQEVEVSPPGATTRCLELRATEIHWEGTPAVAVSMRDVTDRQRAEVVLQQLAQRLDETNRELKRQAIRDPLTGLLNRRGLVQLLPILQASSGRAGGELAALLIDCDNLKRINDEHGHSVGDLAVKHIAERIAAMVRSADAAARIGGDEFVVALPSTGLPQAALVAERIRLAVASKSLAARANPLRVTVSIGVASLPRHVASTEEILTLTRAPLQRGKLGGRNRVCVEGPAPMADEDPRELLLRLVKAPQGLFVASQPIVSLRSGAMVGIELFSRGPPGPLRMPNHLFALAKEEGMLTSLDLQCLRACLAATSAIPTQLPVHINLMPSTIVEVPTSRLAKIFALGDDREFCLEISERQFMGDAAPLTEHLSQLRKEGLSLAIDDVGSTPGTLDNVVLLEPDLVKFDRRIVHGAARDPQKRRVLGRMALLMEALGAEVVAEGVENAEDRDLLLDLGISTGQGYLWARPELMGER